MSHTETIEIGDLSHLHLYDRYIKACCKEVKDVFITAIYFKDENNPGSSGTHIAFHGYPFPLSRELQATILKAINSICNTNFVLRKKAKMRKFTFDTLDDETCPICNLQDYTCMLMFPRDEYDCDGDLDDRPEWCPLTEVKNDPTTATSERS